MGINILTKLILLVLIAGILSCKSSYRYIDYTSNYRLTQELENEFSKDSSPYKFQRTASEFALKGDYFNALKYWDAGFSPREVNYSEGQKDSLRQIYTVVNAKDFIINQAKTREIMIINESHHNSMHRVFTKLLLNDLYKIGYRYLGLEALFYEDSMDSLNRIRKYPVLKTGYYTADPNFGNLIREAIETGYQLFPYETQTEGSNGYQREIDQVRNIKSFLDKNPGGKTLIHCGFDHAMEGKHSSWEKAMAERLKEYTGLDPVTINQVVFSEKSDPKYNHPLLKTFQLNGSSVLSDKTGNSYKIKREESYFDIAVFHKNPGSVEGRPEWIFDTPNQKYEVKLKGGLPIEYPVMVLAYKSDEDINQAVPMDICEANGKNDKCILGLKKGKYKFVITNGERVVFTIRMVK